MGSNPTLSASRAARLLLVGDGLSAFGAWIDFLAILTLAAWRFHVTPYEMALVSAAGLLPGMLAAPAIGRWCDQGAPKRLLLGSIAGRMLATAAILSGGGFAPFVACVALRSLFASVAPPAINVLAVRAVEADARPRFYALLNVLNNAAKVLAPALGTVSSSLAGEGFALALSLACSAGALAAFMLVDAPAAAPAADAPPGSAATSATGLVPVLWVAATCAFFVFMVNNLMPLVLQRAGLDKALLGILVGCAGAGNLVSGLWLARPGSRSATGLAALLRPALAQALGFGAIGLVLARLPAHAAALLPLLFFAIGTASARYAIALNVHLAANFAGAIGRASGQLQAWQNAMILLAPAIGAAVFEARGTPALFALATGSALVSFALLAAVAPTIGRTWHR